MDTKYSNSFKLLLNSLFKTITKPLDLAILLDQHDEVYLFFSNPRLSQEETKNLLKNSVENDEFMQGLVNLSRENFENIVSSYENFNLIISGLENEFKVIFLAKPTIDMKTLFPYIYLLTEKMVRIQSNKGISFVIPNFKVEAVQYKLPPHVQQVFLEPGEFVMKVIIGGDSRAGKTTLVEQFVHEQFKKDYKSTIGVNIVKRRIDYPHWKIKLILSIYDMGGQEHYFNVRKSYYRGAQAGFLLYDVTNPDSFNNIEKWYEEIVQIIPDVMLILVANKIDLKDERKITKKQGKELARKLKMKYFETSALMKDIVDEAFNTLGFLYILQKRIVHLKEIGGK